MGQRDPNTTGLKRDEFIAIFTQYLKTKIETPELVDCMKNMVNMVYYRHFYGKPGAKGNEEDLKDAGICKCWQLLTCSYIEPARVYNFLYTGILHEIGNEINRGKKFLTLPESHDKTEEDLEERFPNGSDVDWDGDDRHEVAFVVRGALVDVTFAPRFLWFLGMFMRVLFEAANTET